jgi:DNA-binding response OmpR family regulator
MNILLIEDEPGIAAVIKQGLEEARYTVDVAHDGVTGLDLALNGSYALLIPILMLTARDAVDDRVRGLEMGADDYLPKPFAFRELRARVRALVRRDRIHKGRILRIADLEIDTGSQRVTRAGQEILLTQREYLLLEALATREGQVLTRELIQQQVWRDDESYSNTVDVHISALRKKIDTGKDVKLIHTVHGRGYMVRGPNGEEFT